MEAKVLKDNLEMAVAEVNRVVSKRATLPIVHNVLLRTKEGRLTVTATDLEVTVTAYVGAQVVAEGASTVPAVKLSQMLKMLKRIKADEAMTVKAVKGKTTFSMDGRTFSLEGEAAKDYPPTPDKFDKRGEVEGGELKDRLKRVVICARTDDSRPVLQAVNVKAEGGTLTLTAADGFMLGTFAMPYKGQELEANVPLSVIRVLLRLLEDDVAVGLDVSEHTIRFTLRNYDVTGTLISGSFPNYKQLVPEPGQYAVRVQRDDLRSEVETAQVLAQDGSGIVRFLADKAGLRVVAKSEEVGDYEGTVPAVIEGAGGKVALNGRYVLNTLDRMVAGPVSMDWQPGRIVRFEQGTDGFYLVMPMMVSW